MYIAGMNWRLISAAFALVCSHAALGGPDFVEPIFADAGSTPATAMPTTGPGPLKSIAGKLALPTDGDIVDYEDMFIINIVAPTQFCVKTVVIGDINDCCAGEYLPHTGSNFNTQLFLFQADGRGLLANDDSPRPAPPGQSLMRTVATDGTGAMVVAPGVYFIAISAGPQRDPVSAGGPIFNQAVPNEISGPDGPGGLQPIVGWTGAGITNVQYEMTLCGVDPMPGVPTLSEWALLTLTAMLMLAGAAMLARRNRLVAATIDSA